MKSYNIKDDLPDRLEAGKRLADIIRACQGREKVIKIIHGYGSQGIGGSIKQLVHKSLRNKRKKKEIKAFIPGEAFASPMGFDEAIGTYRHLIKDDPDYKRMNDGITFVIL